MNRKKLTGIAAATLVGLTLLACSGAPGEDTSTKKDSVTTVETPSAKPEETKDSGPVVAKLGSKGLVFDAEKIDVAISTPSAYKPGKYAERPGKDQRAFVVTVTVVNHNTQAINPGSLSITASLGEASAEMNSIFDIDAGLKGTPDTALLPGKTVKFKYGFVGPTDEKTPVVNINVTPWELGSTTGLFAGNL